MVSGQPGRRPDVVIRQSGGGTEIRIGDANPVPVPLVGARTLRAHVNRFIKTIESVRPDAPQLSAEAARDFISTARTAAYKCFARCVDDSYDKIGNLVGEIQSHMLRWRRPGDPPFVEIVVNDAEYLPWEWLAAPTPGSISRVEGPEGYQQDGHELLDSMEDILGFGAIARRVLLKSEPIDTPVNRQYLVAVHNKLQIRYVRHLVLAGASQQQGYFNRHGAVVNLVGPVPDAELGLPVGLGTQLLNPGAGYISGEQRLGGLDQILHIHCHHGTTRDEVVNPDDFWATSKLVLLDDPPLEVTFEELEDEIIVPEARREFQHLDRPLVFLNACSGDFHPLSMESFSRLFARNGNRGVVSTSIRVPDQVAASFAAFFYDSLLYDPGITVGAALQKAKVNLLTRFNNPLGILYTYAGDPDLVITPSLSALVQAPMPI